jgi:hypothetical protein
MFVCKICDKQFESVPSTAVKLAQSIFKFEDGTVHILSRRKLKPTQPTQKDPNRCQSHWPLNQHISKADCEYCSAVAVKE